MHQRTEDLRSRKIVALSHCVLNQNSTVRGGARFAAMMEPIVSVLLEADVGMYQMPCPEMSFAGALRRGRDRTGYDTPAFREHCTGIAQRVLHVLQDYHRNGYALFGFIMIDGSPSCGLEVTVESVGREKGWAGEVYGGADYKFSKGPGVFCEILRAEAERFGLGNLRYIAIPEFDDAEVLVEGVAGMLKELRAFQA